jgi:uncharacterized protein
VKFWDASAVVALLVDEAGQARVRRYFDEDPAMIVWWGTRTECISALVRRERDGSIDAAGVTAAVTRLRRLTDVWREVLPTNPVRDLAERMLRAHPLRAADALQLAAAVMTAADDPGALTFVSLDERLNEAAAREGLTVL